VSSFDAVTAWVAAYRQAWETSDPDQIGGLFAEDGAYFTEPYAKPWLGRAQIIENWLANRDEPGTTTFEWHPLIVTDDVAIIEATTTYPDKTFSNLWVLRLDNVGQAHQFTEWWMMHPLDDA